MALLKITIEAIGQYAGTSFCILDACKEFFDSFEELKPIFYKDRPLTEGSRFRQFRVLGKGVPKEDIELDMKCDSIYIDLTNWPRDPYQFRIKKVENNTIYGEMVKVKNSNSSFPRKQI